MNLPDFTFKIDSLEDLLTAAGIVDDDDRVHLAGKKLKELAVSAVAIKADLIKCHEICTELGLPDFGGGTVGLRKRLEFFNERQKKP
jgi:hypothetical protein